MHYIGGIDSKNIINEAILRKIPFIYINHYANICFTYFSIRTQIEKAACIAGLTNIDVPRRLKKSFINVSSGIDLNKYDPFKVRSTIECPKLPIIFYPARIVENKGQKDLITACYNLQKEGFKVKIVLAGRIDSVQYERDLLETIDKYKLSEHILFVGLLSVEEILKWYTISSILAFPTYHPEGLSRILLESQAMKVPPVAYNVGGNSGAMINGKTGFLIKKGDIEHLSQKLAYLLKNEDKRIKMGEEGREYVLKNFSIKSMAERHEKLYLKALKGE